MLQPLRSFRRAILALVVAGSLGLLLFGLPPATGATTKTGHDFTYYSDSSHTKVVGYRYYCPGYSGGWGVITGYSVMNNFPCH